ncbi:MAG: hypothetical protein CMM49_08055 [Rhodospirillaceae bacterium]|nr:hypothetical protein [Rhodospirillaceae bacterium]|tara:strand:- start:12894 stop:13385 length:492 start_codon:yes stop_codon:yes gene_type:complete
MKFKLFKILFINISLVIFLSTSGAAESGNSNIYIDFTKFENTKKYNSYILCPKDYCKNVTPNKFSPKIEISMVKLKNILINIIYVSQRVKFVKYKKNHYQFVQKSKVFRFPDIIDVKFLKLDGYVSFIIYSRSKYGLFDFSMNKNRVENWINQLNSKLNEGLN